MENRKERRSSPRRGYMSPNRKRRSRSRSTGHHRRLSSPHGRRLSRDLPKRRKSRSPVGAYSKFRISKEDDVYTQSRRSRSSDRKPRKHDEEIRKPVYRGPENNDSLKRAVTSPSRIIVYRRIGENKSHFNDDKLVIQKQIDGNEDRKDMNKDDGRFVYIQIQRKGENGPSKQSSYEERRNFYEAPGSPNERNSSPTRHNYEHQMRRDYELNTHGKEYETNRRYKNDDYDRSDRSKKHDKKYCSSRSDKPYSEEEKKSRVTHTRDGSKDRHHYDKYDKYEEKHRRNNDARRGDTDHHYKNRDEEYDDHQKSEKPKDNPRNSYDNEQNEESNVTNEGAVHINGGVLVPGSVRPVHFDNNLRGIPRQPAVPMAHVPIGFIRPMAPIPGLRPFHPFLPRPPHPFGIPLIRRFGPHLPRFYTHPIPQ